MMSPVLHPLDQEDTLALNLASCLQDLQDLSRSSMKEFLMYLGQFAGKYKHTVGKDLRDRLQSGGEAMW